MSNSNSNNNCNSILYCGYGLNTTKVGTLTNKEQNDVYHYPYTINKKIHSAYYIRESRISFLF